MTVLAPVTKPEDVRTREEAELRRRKTTAAAAAVIDKQLTRVHLHFAVLIAVVDGGETDSHHVGQHARVRTAARLAVHTAANTQAGCRFGPTSCLTSASQQHSLCCSSLHATLAHTRLSISLAAESRA